ncbi:MAG TPA: ABC transporter substrate-binding protein [Candidatus Binataceae bacterium]|nr:ABC transporter substrate-binding protein [Candidatus Binataceae bacterium]
MNFRDNIRTQSDEYRNVLAIAREHRPSLAGLIAAGALALAMMIVNLVAVAHGATTVGDPMTMVQTTVGQVLDTLQTRGMPQTERQRRVIAIVANRFDFTGMARSSLGYNWKTLAPAQQQQFVPLFTAFMEDAYLSKINDYSGQQVKFTGQSTTGDGTAEVKSVVQPSDQSQPPIHINYLLRQVAGQWKVYDVAIDEISITANYRNQFNRVIASRGFDALMSAMREKQQALHDSIGA